MAYKKVKKFIEPFIYILPLIIFTLFFVLIPILGTIFTSFYQDITFLEKKFVLFQNYQHLLLDKSFWSSFVFTLLFTLVSVAAEIILGLLFAMLVNETVPLRGFLRGCMLIPWAIPSAISARIWELIYNYSYGLANFLCLKSTLCKEPVNWLGTQVSAFFALTVADVWKTTPFLAIILLAGLQSIPQELYSQSKIDGASIFQRFFKITLPLLKPFLIVALLFRSIDSLRIFDIIYVLTHGGPGGATTSVSLYSYKYFLMGDFGYGSAISVVLFLIALLLSIFYVKVGQFKKGII